jgi:hypothetical protein
MKRADKDEKLNEGEPVRGEGRTVVYWLQTFTGKKIDLINPTREMVDIEDIAQSLSMICRYNGHCRDFYSVAEHSVMVEAMGSQILLRQILLRREAERNSGRLSAPPKPTSEIVQQSLSLLLHDAAEAYIGDITTPLKRGLESVGGDVVFPPEARMSKIEELERRWLLVIGEAFGLGDRLAEPSEVMRQADEKVMSVEVTMLFHPVQSSWWETRSRPRSGEMVIQCWAPAEARRQFISRFRVLYENLYSKTSWSEVGETRDMEEGVFPDPGLDAPCPGDDGDEFPGHGDEGEEDCS